MYFKAKYMVLGEHKAVGLKLVEEGWGGSGNIREDFLGKLCVDRRLVFSRQSQYLDSSPLILRS